ncbi:nucleotide-binding domain-containing protein [Nostoc sp.]|uniref:nucleotide-binding domain-containing protein n=1 Tax=Nostoc sp. TaxID=1180 RepID=UPI002FF66B7F
MFMYDISNDLQYFYDNYVRLGVKLRQQLAGYRDLNINRLKNGLDNLAKETERPHPYPYDSKNQGGYPMHTLNQDPNNDNDYDIDIALIFHKDEIPENPLKARQRVRDALCKRCTNFTKEPEARTNAVTVWYAEGYHIDFAIYRTYVDEFGIERIEHASTEWKRRDPMEINNWFAECVSRSSPKANSKLGYYPKVAEGQMRRIVRFVKWFCRSRTSWSLPGGMIVSTLIAELGVYKANGDCDDIALYDTMVALRDRLKLSCKVYNPVDSSQELTGKTEVLNQVTRLRDNLNIAISKLDVLFDQSCTREKARYAWDWVFNHEFWVKKEITEVIDFANIIAIARYSLIIRCDLAKYENGPTYKQYLSGSSILPKGVALKFTVVSTNVPQPYSVRWIINNEGDEAQEAEQLCWESSDSGMTKWTSTAYKGNHRMTCQIEKNGQVMAKAVHIVKIMRSGNTRNLSSSRRGFG